MKQFDNITNRLVDDLKVEIKKGSINELIILSNAESRNAQMIREGISKEEQFNKIKEIAQIEFESLHNYDANKSLKKLTQETYLLEDKKESKNG